MASWVLSVIRNRSPLLMMTLFKTMVIGQKPARIQLSGLEFQRSILDIKALENIQRSFTKKIMGCQDLTYNWNRLKKLNVLSLQIRRERYCIIHVWKMLHGVAPNDIELITYTHSRLGNKIRLPPLNNKAQTSVKTDYENSFKIKASRLRNLLPKSINAIKILDLFKEALWMFLNGFLDGFLNRFLDIPPVPGYTTVNRNSLLDRRNEKGGRT